MDKMDATKVELVMSAKGCAMLLVDDYLYHYDDRGYKSFRWVCNKRKDKKYQCRARVITMQTDGETESKRHCVKKVVGEHTHDRCTESELFKAYDRRRLANLAGRPCTLVSKVQKRKQRRFAEIINTMELENQEFTTDDDYDDDEADIDDPAAVINNGVEQAMDNAVLPSATGENEMSLKWSNDIAPMQIGNGPIYFEDGLIYFLKKPNGEPLACLDGHLYKLSHRTDDGTTFHWQCVRQQLNCSISMCTQSLSNGKHRLNELIAMHTHEAYTAGNLNKVMAQNQLSLQIDDAQQPANTQPMAAANDNCDEFQSELSTDAINTSPHANDIQRLSFKPRANDIDNTYELCDDPMTALDADKTTNGHGNAATGRKKYTFLPSAKGNKVLCLDNFLYHFDSRSNTNGNAYWTCILRRDKVYRCNGRVITKTTTSGPRILKVSGTHEHPNNASDIRRRLFKSIVAKKCNEHYSMQTISSTITTALEDPDFNVADMKRTIERSIERRQRKKRKLQAAAKAKEQAMLQEVPQETNQQFDDVVQEEYYYDELHEEVMTTESAPLHNDIANETAVRNPDLILDDNGNVYYSHDGEAFQTVVLSTADCPKINCIDDIIEELPMDETYTTFDYTEAIPQEPQQLIFDNNYISMDGTITSYRMDITKLSTLRTTTGGELLCVDGYLYHLKRVHMERSYWSCVKLKDPTYKCQSRLTTINDNDGYLSVIKVGFQHTHIACVEDIQQLACATVVPIEQTTGDNYNLEMEQAFCDISNNYVNIMPANTTDDVVVYCDGNDDDHVVQHYDAYPLEEEQQQFSNNIYNDDNEFFQDCTCSMKLYAVSDGPPSLAVRMALKALNLPYELHSVDYVAAEHMSEEYAKMNPQKEIPVLEDNGFFLSESIAILQYLCDKYAPDSPLYPKDANARAIVNHRLCFNMGFYYSTISAHVMAPIFFDYKRNDMSLKKLTNALDVFETYLQRGGTKYAAANHLTIADLALVGATLCLEAIAFDLSPYPLVKTWYETFKSEYPELWEVAKGGMKEIEEFEKNPPDLSHMNHPFHPTRKLK